MTYRKHIQNAQTGEMTIIEISEHQFRCDKLGLPESTTEADVNAAWESFQTAAADRETRETLRETKYHDALVNLKTADWSNVQTALNAVTDPAAKLLLTRLVQVVRLLVIETLAGDD